MARPIAGVAGGGLNQHRFGRGRFCLLLRADRIMLAPNPVFDGGGGGSCPSQLHHDLGQAAFRLGNAVELHQGSVANQVSNVVGNRHGEGPEFALLV